MAVVWGHWEARFGSTFALILALAQYSYLQFGDPDKIPEWVKTFPPWLWLAIGLVILFWSCYLAWGDQYKLSAHKDSELIELRKKNVPLITGAVEQFLSGASTAGGSIL